MSSRSPTHRLALIRALELGCNLIDTASNYAKGESEMLIGDVLHELGATDAFVVTKAGYVSEPDVAFLRPTLDGDPGPEVVILDDGTRHCIHPVFLHRQIGRSLRRLRRSQVDGFLLHNPEYFLRTSGAAGSENELYRRIGAAFALLEELCDEGVIGSYGVSSNALTPLRSRPGAISLPKLIETAAHVRSANRFRLIEFPCNLVETAAADCPAGGPSVVSLAKAHGLVTLANRPLNAKVGGRPLRLADGGDGLDTECVDESVDRVFDRVKGLVERRLASRPTEAGPDALANLDGLRLRWGALDHVDVVEALFQGLIFPSIIGLYPDGIQPDAQGAIMDLRSCARRHALVAMREKARTLRAHLAASGAIRGGDGRPLEVIACEAVMKLGVEHVLVGMRRPGYVEGLHCLF
ncbi:MAG: hypothetical protein GY937_21170 [bacterium]|nr:hypothetical protein [bacterium]